MSRTHMAFFVAVFLAAGLAHAASAGKWVVVTGPECNVRSGPAKSNKKIEALGQFAPVKITGNAKDEYVPVETKAGAKGWAHQGVLGANDFVSAASRDCDVRFGPDAKEAVAFQPSLAGYPFRVTGAKGDHIEVVDFEGDKGWVARSALSAKRTCIVKGEKANGRTGPAVKYDVLFRAAHGVVLDVLERQGDWVQVKHADGNRGWILKEVLWGAVDIPGKDASAAPASAPTQGKSPTLKPASSAKRQGEGKP